MSRQSLLDEVCAEFDTRAGDRDSIPLALLFSSTGGLAAVEQSIAKGALLAVEEVNAAGGIDGRELVPVSTDFGSNYAAAPTRISALLDETGAVAAVGGYTSSSRVAMLPAFLGSRALLLYSTYFEGLESEPNVFYSGAIPNQFLVDYVDWIIERLGRKIYLLGSDYVYPRSLGAIVRKVARRRGGEVVGGRYVPLGATNFDAVLQEIRALAPDVVFSNLVGTDSTSAFYRGFAAAGHTPYTLPIAATVTTEFDVRQMGAENAFGHYMTATYFGSLRNPANRRYVAALRRRFGACSVVHAPQVGAYNAVWLFALAAGRCGGDLTPENLRGALTGITFDRNPEGDPLRIHPNHYTSHASYIGCAGADGQYEIVQKFPCRPPEPYPSILVPTSKRPTVFPGELENVAGAAPRQRTSP
ncbi:MAG: transporter substrate-binding protein [Actinomycetota bacterium]|nr:transporter substrate-binding protein [Actinomycetota bacterium]